MENFIIEHTVCKGGWYFDSKLNYVQGASNAYIWKNEDEFYAIANSPIGRCKTTIRQKIYKFVTIKNGVKTYKTFEDNSDEK